MKEQFRRIAPWLVGAAAFTFTLCPQVAFAGESIRTIIDGRLITFDIAPIIQNDRTLVPMRGFLTTLGAEITWDQETATAGATLGSFHVEAVIGSMVATVNGQPVDLDLPAQLIDDRTMVPLRFFAESLGLAVTWDGDTQTIWVDSRQMGALASRDGATANRTGLAIVEAARKQVGGRYAWGGTSPSTGFDCSGFITYLSDLFGLNLPRTSHEMWRVGVPVQQADLMAGDLVFFSTYDDGASHVGVYDGEGSFIHSQSAETGVTVTALSKEWWAVRYLGARRVIR